MEKYIPKTSHINTKASKRITENPVILCKNKAKSLFSLYAQKTALPTSRKIVVSRKKAKVKRLLMHDRLVKRERILGLLIVLY